MTQNHSLIKRKSDAAKKAKALAQKNLDVASDRLAEAQLVCKAQPTPANVTTLVNAISAYTNRRSVVQRLITP